MGISTGAEDSGTGVLWTVEGIEVGVDVGGPKVRASSAAQGVNEEGAGAGAGAGAGVGAGAGAGAGLDVIVMSWAGAGAGAGAGWTTDTLAGVAITPSIALPTLATPSSLIPPFNHPSVSRHHSLIIHQTNQRYG